MLVYKCSHHYALSQSESCRMGSGRWRGFVEYRGGRSIRKRVFRVSSLRFGRSLPVLINQEDYTIDQGL